MSDEEKKAIEWLKKADWFSARLYSPTILNLIEKQSKEIEKYKNELNRSLYGICLNDYISKDKIKAMIENDLINISGFECFSKGDVQALLEEE